MIDRVVVQIVFGSEDIDHLIHRLVPSLIRATSAEIDLWTLDYSSTSAPILPSRIGRVTIHSFGRNRNSATGFAENHNRLFAERGTMDDFVVLNPDCILADSSIDNLFATKNSKKEAAIVEGRQWPFEHPKEFDSSSYETPWASGAFSPIDGDFYAEIGGMDEGYFMYLEDVDLSWRAWLSGRAVVYEPRSVVAHFSGGPFYRSDVTSTEEYFGLRNFIRIAYKFFGDEGEARAVELLKEQVSQDVVRNVVEDYRLRIKPLVRRVEGSTIHAKVKILGVNQFHHVRKALIPR